MSETAKPICTTRLGVNHIDSGTLCRSASLPAAPVGLREPERKPQMGAVQDRMKFLPVWMWYDD